MAQCNVNLPDEMEQFIVDQISSGQFSSVSDVVRAALRSLQREQEEHVAKIEAVRSALDSGAKSGVSDKTLEDIWQSAEQRYLANNG